MCSFLYNTNDGYMITSSATLGAFAEGRALFYFERARMATRDQVKGAEDLDYGIVPIPKYDETQDTYSCIMGNPFTLYAIPIDNDESEMPPLCMSAWPLKATAPMTPALLRRR